MFYRGVNHVRPSLIRVDADEVTYNLRIVPRFELERDLINGDLPTEDVPPDWNRNFKELFDLEVKRDSEGCLQDVHWSAGLIGYFPVYLLGNLYAAQLFAKAKQDIPHLLDHFRPGDFYTLRQ